MSIITNSTQAKTATTVDISSSLQKEQHRQEQDHNDDNSSSIEKSRCDRLALLTKLLYLYSQTHPKLGYRQGMHEILAHLLLALDIDESILWTEADAYTLFVSVMMHLAPAFHDHDVRNTSCGDNTENVDSTNNNTVNNSNNKVSMPGESGRRILQMIQLSAMVDQETESAALMMTINNNNSISDEENSQQLADQLRPNYKALLYKHLKEMDDLLNVPPQLYCLKWIRLMFSREIMCYDNAAALITTTTNTSASLDGSVFSFENIKNVNDTKKAFSRLETVDSVLTLWDFYFSNLFNPKSRKRSTTLFHMLECTSAAMILRLMPALNVPSYNDNRSLSTNNNCNDHDTNLHCHNDRKNSCNNNYMTDMIQLNETCNNLMNYPPLENLEGVYDLIRRTAELIRMMKSLRHRRMMIESHHKAAAAATLANNNAAAAATKFINSHYQQQYPKHQQTKTRITKSRSQDSLSKQEISNYSLAHRISHATKKGLQGVITRVDNLIENVNNSNTAVAPNNNKLESQSIGLWNPLSPPPPTSDVADSSDVVSTRNEGHNTHLVVHKMNLKMKNDFATTNLNNSNCGEIVHHRGSNNSKNPYNGTTTGMSQLPMMTNSANAPNLSLDQIRDMSRRLSKGILAVKSHFLLLSSGDGQQQQQQHIHTHDVAASQSSSSHTSLLKQQHSFGGIVARDTSDTNMIAATPTANPMARTNIPTEVSLALQQIEIVRRELDQASFMVSSYNKDYVNLTPVTSDDDDDEESTRFPNLECNISTTANNKDDSGLLAAMSSSSREPHSRRISRNTTVPTDNKQPHYFDSTGTATASATTATDNYDDRFCENNSGHSRSSRMIPSAPHMMDGDDYFYLG